MGKKPLWNKLRKLECHFTWDFEFDDQADVEHLLERLTLQVKHASYKNRHTYVAMKSFLFHSQRRYSDALKSLQEAEKMLQELTGITMHQTLLTYANYAWTYYHLSNYKMVQVYLTQCHGIWNSYPHPTWIPEFLAQKGWSLLFMGFSRGEKAKECFEMALKGDSSNEHFQAGLAISLYASWEHCRKDNYRREAKELLEKVALAQPQNDEIKVYLAGLLFDGDDQRVHKLLKEVFESSLNPEVLRRAAQLCLHHPKSQHHAVAFLKRAISLDPNYHILHYDLGLCYKSQLESASLQNGVTEKLGTILRNFHNAVEMNAFFVDPMLEQAKDFGAEHPNYEEEIYTNLVGEVANISQQCHQALYLQCGDFLLQKRGKKMEAQVYYVMGLNIEGGLGKNLLGKRLMHLAHKFQEDSQTDRAESIYTLLQSAGCEDPGAPHEDLWWHNHRAWR